MNKSFFAFLHGLIFGIAGFVLLFLGITYSNRLYFDDYNNQIIKFGVYNEHLHLVENYVFRDMCNQLMIVVGVMFLSFGVLLFCLSFYYKEFSKYE